MTTVSPLTEVELAEIASTVSAKLVAAFGKGRVLKWRYLDEDVGKAFIRETFLALRIKLHKAEK